MSETKLEIAERILKELTDAAYSTLCESNGVSDNEWKVEGGKAIPEWPVDSFYRALSELSKAHTAAHAYFNPVEAEQARKWENACATASFIVDEYKKNPRGLHRNIADAINGTLVQTMEERAAGKSPTTMDDILNGLVASGDLVEAKP